MASPLTILDRPLYSTGEAADLLGVPPTTLKRWLHGYTHRGVDHPPVIRMQTASNDEVTWGEFVEAGYLREYRQRNVRLQELRPFIDGLRDRFGIPYPLAHFKPFVAANRHLVLDLQEELGLDRRLFAVMPSRRNQGQQLVLSGPASAFLDKVEFDPQTDIATAIRPLGPTGLVEIRPDLSFGIPTVNGIRTEILHEAFLAGESVDAIARAWELDVVFVEAAMRWEARETRAVAAGGVSAANESVALGA